jgi:hypothetical protein
LRHATTVVCSQSPSVVLKAFTVCADVVLFRVFEMTGLSKFPPQ